MGPERQVELTEEGLKEAESLIRRHRLSERLLTDILGMPWAQAHDEACRLEHVISPVVEEKLAAALAYPTTCPHGNPIPGSSGPDRRLVRLGALEVGVGGYLRCIEAEDEEFLEYLQGLGLVPGARVDLVSRAPFGGPLELTVDGAAGYIGPETAERLLLEPDSGQECRRRDAQGDERG